MLFSSSPHWVLLHSSWPKHVSSRWVIQERWWSRSEDHFLWIDRPNGSRLEWLSHPNCLLRLGLDWNLVLRVRYLCHIFERKMITFFAVLSSYRLIPYERRLRNACKEVNDLLIESLAVSSSDQSRATTFIAQLLWKWIDIARAAFSIESLFCNHSKRTSSIVLFSSRLARWYVERRDSRHPHPSFFPPCLNETQNEEKENERRKGKNTQGSVSWQ